MKVGGMLAGAVCLALAGAGGWFLRAATVASGVAEESEHEESVAPADMSVEVVAETARAGDLTTTLAVFGVVRATERELRTVSTRASGRVEAVLKRPGDEVSADSPLFRIERAPLETAVAQARAAVTAAENALAAFDQGGRARKTADLESAVAGARTTADLASRQAERVVALRKEGLSSDRARADASQAAERARLDLAVAERALEAYRTSEADLERASLAAARDAATATFRDAEAVLGAAEVVASTAGRLTAVTVRVGERVEAGAELGVLLVGDGREVAFGVTPSRRATIPDHARVRWEDADGSERKGTVRAFSALVDQGLGLQEVLVTPDEGQPAAAPGTIVKGEIDLARIQGAVLVPTRAVLRTGGAPGVVVVVDGTAKPVPVEVLGRRGGTSAVKGDVRAGDRVVVQGGYNLPSGAKVHAAEGKDESAAHPGETHATEEGK